jgi:hypothetical protein
MVIENKLFVAKIRVNPFQFMSAGLISVNLFIRPIAAFMTRGNAVNPVVEDEVRD